MNAPEKIVEPPRWERRKESRPAELMDAALDLFVEKGFAATRLDDVAKRAGVSKGTLYLYFDSKEDLFKAVVREGFGAKYLEAEELIASFPGPSDVLLATLMRRWWNEIGATRLSGIPKLIVGEAGNFPEITRFYHEEVMQKGLSLFRSVIERGVARGEFRPVNVDHVTRLCCSPVVMLMVWRHSFELCACGSVDPLPYLESHIGMLLAGLRHGPEAPPPNFLPGSAAPG